MKPNGVRLVGPPKNEAELLERAGALAGRSLAALADQADQVLPRELARAKGWIGQLVEALLGATADNRSLPDFEALGVELKTVPVDRAGQPKESTFVCTASLGELAAQTWPTSTVRKKLSRVLWVPVEADPALPLCARRIGMPCLWSPSEVEEAGLAADWTEFAELIARGYHESVDARRGVWLQLRPKGADARARAWVRDADGEALVTTPRGFYLRRAFTVRLLQRHYHLPGT